MSDSVRVSVRVAVSPDVAFDLFTREIDSWYRVDPDTLPDITRTAAIRFEPHVGGRLIDVHDLASDEGRELGRVTAWDPGRRLAFTDNEGTEVEVTFEPVGAGTRVVLTHRGLDRLASQRAAAVRRAGWAALAPFYYDHVRANAPAVGMAAGSLLVFGVLGGLIVALVLVLPRPVVWILPLLFGAALTIVYRLEDRLIRRWRLSRWQNRRISSQVGAVLGVGFLIYGVYGVSEHHSYALTAIGVPVMLVLTCLSDLQAGPANGRSMRNPAVAARPTFAARHPLALISIAGAVALSTGLTDLVDVPTELVDVAFGALITLTAARSLRAGYSKGRQQRILGLDPDLYLAVTRALSEHDRQPEVLVHHPSQHPEYSGWYAYAGDRDEDPCDLIAWTVKDLIDHSPETARPLREGDGTWKWDHAKRSYYPAQTSDHIAK